MRITNCYAEEYVLTVFVVIKPIAVASRRMQDCNEIDPKHNRTLGFNQLKA